VLPNHRLKLTARLANFLSARSLAGALDAPTIKKIGRLLTTCRQHDTFKRTVGGVDMSKVPNIIPITDLRQDAASVLRRVRASREPVFITQRGRAAAVMMSTEEYERSEHDKELLHLLARGEKDISEGKTLELEAVLTEARALLKEG
jgi:prevent-host-death family protein